MKTILRVAALLMLAQFFGAGSRILAQTCTLSTLNGSYAFSASGLVPLLQAQGSVRFQPFAEVGLVKFDGAGNVTVAGRVQTQGNIANANYTGTYKVDTGCTGSATFTDSSDKLTMRWEFVVVSSGSEITTLALIPKSDTRPLFSTSFTQKKV